MMLSKAALDIASDADAEEEESESAKLTDCIHELLLEFRMILPGVNVLLGFQLAVFLMPAFESLPHRLQVLHFVSLSFTVASVVLLMTPAAYHRRVERGQPTQRFIHFASRMMLAGQSAMGIGLALEFAVVAFRVSPSPRLAVALVLAAVILMAFFWQVLPRMAKRMRQK